MSTDGQALGLQVEQLRAAGTTRVYRETASGSKRDRVQLAKLLKDMQLGDVVLVTRLDRSACSTRDLLHVLGSLADKGAMFRSLADPWATPPPRTAGSC
ncbi:recombinase family protein [Rubellimicrobium rubrum]|uniref:recombinase family protein n=1 Tax=Rubellimicrobium rubrum TaxID=2585369 RepID=UPI001C3F1BC6